MSPSNKVKMYRGKHESCLVESQVKSRVLKTSKVHALPDTQYVSRKVVAQDAATKGFESKTTESHRGMSLSLLTDKTT